MLLGLGGQSGIWAILAFVPLVNIVSVIFLFIAIHHVGLKLQKEGWFVLLAIFVPLVWLVWLAFDKSTWQTAEGAPATPPLPGAQPATPAPAPITPAPEPVETASESATAETEPATVAEQPVEEPAPVVTPEPVNEPVADTETSPTVEQPTEEPEPATEPASSSDEEPKPPVA